MSIAVTTMTVSFWIHIWRSAEAYTTITSLNLVLALLQLAFSMRASQSVTKKHCSFPDYPSLKITIYAIDDSVALVYTSVPTEGWPHLATPVPVIDTNQGAHQSKRLGPEMKRRVFSRIGQALGDAPRWWRSKA